MPHFVQYEQDTYSQKWFVEHLQTSNDLSPWDLSLKSPFIKPGTEHDLCFDTPSLTSAEDVIAYVSTLECAASFLGAIVVEVSVEASLPYCTFAFL